MKNILPIFLLWMLSATSVYAIPGYELTDLGTLGGSWSAARGINDLGQVVGTSFKDGSYTHYAFVWQNGIMTEIGTLGGDWSNARDINFQGQVVGASSNASGDHLYDTRAYVYDKGTMSELEAFRGNSRGDSINDLGQVVGFSSRSSTNVSPHATLWENGQKIDLGHLGGGVSYAYDINTNSQIVGHSFISEENPYAEPGGSKVLDHAFLWESGNMYDLGTLSGENSINWGSQSGAYGINDLGQVVGASHFDLTHKSHAFLWEDGVMTDLGSLNGEGESFAYKINNLGQVVGNLSRGGFLWENGTMYDLNDLVFTDYDFYISQALDINNSGQIVGTGTVNFNNPDNAETHGYLLTPEWDATVTTNQFYLTDYLTLGNYFSFDAWWEMDQEPDEFNFDILFFYDDEWKFAGWDFNFDGSSTEWNNLSFLVPEWARGLETQIKFVIADLGQTTNPTVYLRNISSSEPVPEPSTIILLFTGLVGLAGWGRKKLKIR